MTAESLSCRPPLRHMEPDELARLGELRRLLNEPALVDVEVMRHGGGTWWRLHVACRCTWAGPGVTGLPICLHPVRLRMVPGGEFRKPHRLARRLGLPATEVSDEDARRVVRALHAFVEGRWS